jgi:signal transduction histidine kinase
MTPARKHFTGWGAGSKRNRGYCHMFSADSLPAKSTFNWSKIHLVYFALAAFDLMAIAAGLWLSEWGKAEHERTVTVVSQASVLRETLRESQSYLLELNAISNEIFLSKDINAASKALTQKQKQFGLIFSKNALDGRMKNMWSGLQVVSKTVAETKLAAHLNQLDPKIVAHFVELHAGNQAAATAMLVETSRTIGSFKSGNESEAAQHMAVSDAAFRKAVENTISSTVDLDRQMNEMVENSKVVFETSTFWQYVVGGSILAMIGLACLYAFTVGHVLKRKYMELEKSNAEAEKYGADVARINDEVTNLNVDLADKISKLKDAQDELIKKGRMEQLGQLTATVAHELRNPLGSVRTSAFLLRRKTDGKGLALEPQIDRIENGVTRCDNIITQLLDFSRTKLIEAKPADLDEWLEQVLREQSVKIDPAISIRCELGLNGLQIPFDSARLQRAIINLMSNAAEAMMTTKGFEAKAPAIDIVTERKGGFVQIAVTDNGPGISADVIVKVREPLFTTKNFGTGLGVPAIEQIATQHGGSLDIASEPGRGATFTINLPISGTGEAKAA